MIKRKAYLDKLHQLEKANVIKVLTGIRRAGKSTILQMFRQEVVDAGTPTQATQYINFEDPDFQRSDDWHDIYDEIKSNLVSGKKNYIFLDEIQQVKEFERLADGLFILDDVDLYITGSNAYFLSGELATFLTGRYMEIMVLPLSFAEYHDFFKAHHDLDRTEKFERYLKYGGFPEVANFIKSDIEAQIPDYLETIYKTIVEKDIIPRYDIRSRDAFDRILKFTVDSVGSKVSVNSIRNSLNTERQATEQIGVERVDNYLTALTNSYILRKVDRFDIKGKEILRTLDKYYLIDTGLRNMLLGKDFAVDRGHTLENVVYLELLRRGYQVWIGKAGDKEVDFVARRADGTTEYYQVTNHMQIDKVIRREVAALDSIADHNAKFIITRDPGEKSYNGIEQVNVIDWLLQEQN
jgi:predicted AAA+ superfamily ATPase